MTQETISLVPLVRLVAAYTTELELLRTLRDQKTPHDLSTLVDVYSRLGVLVSTAEAILVSALNAADPHTPLDRETRSHYQALIPKAFELLHAGGRMFAGLDRPFSDLVHGGGGWPNRPIEHDGVTLYENTFKTSQTLSPEVRHAEYTKRVDRFLSEGGDFTDIILLTAESIRALKPWSHFDYVMLPDLETRVYPTAAADRNGKPKAGHSLLIGTGSDFEDRHVLSAGELWILKDYTGELEAVVIANNSGHFKPAFSALENTMPGLEALNVRRDQIVRFGGPNNIPAIFREITEIHGIQGLEAKGPPNPVDLIHSWHT